MIAVLYFVTASILLELTRRFVRPISVAAALLLILLPMIFTGRAVLTGKAYAPLEMPYMTRPLSDHRTELHVPDWQNSALNDIAFQMMPWREAVRRSLADGEWPLWNRFIFCGDVLAAAMQPAVFSPFTLIACLLPTAVSFGFTGAIAFFIAGLGAFLLAREIGLSERASLFAAIGWMFSAQLALTILWPLGFAWAYLPLTMAATRRLVYSPDIRAIGVLTAALALNALAGHPETLLHVVAISVAYGLYHLRHSEKRGRAIGAALTAGVFALLLSAIALLPFLDAVRNTGEYNVRKDLYAKYPLRPRPADVRAALAGNFFPFVRGGIQFPLERAEAGSMLLALGITALSLRRKETLFFAALLVVSLLAGINAWPVAQFLHRLPLFSAAFNDRLAAAAALSLAILAAFAFEAWPAKRIAAIMTILAVIISVAIVVASRPFDQTRAIGELAPLAVAAIVVRFVRREVAAPLVIALLIMQRTISDGALVPTYPKELAFPRVGLLASIPSGGDPFRIAPFANAMMPNTPTMYGLEDVRGNTPTTFGPFIETFPMWIVKPGWFYEVQNLETPMLAMMNVRYSFVDVSMPIPPGWRDVTAHASTRLIENERVLSRAFIPARVRVGRTHAQQIEEMKVENDFSQRAWLVIPGEVQEWDNGPGRVSVSRIGADLKLHVSMERQGYIVISETAWPGWRAYLDGRRVNHFVANVAFLGVFVPAGEHDVRLTYLPQSFVVGRMITFSTILLIAALIAARRFMN